MRRATLRVALTVSLLALAAPGAAQVLPTGPVRLFDGQVTLSGEVSATAGQSDDEAFFNYTDYERNALRLFRASLAGVWRPFDRLALVAEVRSEDFEAVTPFAAYVRIRPWPRRRLDIQAGRIPPVFGAFARRAYGFENALVGYPLGYQYLTSLRPDSLPISADDLLRMRGRGWRSSFPVGRQDAAPGLPLVSAFRWDTGVEVRWGWGPLEASAAATAGTLSNPRVSDDNDRRQLSGRVSVAPITGLVVGASGAHGGWISNDAGIGSSRLAQTATGIDAEYSRDHWLVRAEGIRTRWELPWAPATSNGRDVSAWTLAVEGRYRFTPRVFAAARVDHLGFSTVTDPFTGAGVEWDAPVDRLELVGGYYLQRNVVLRLAVQSNWREVGRVNQRTFTSAQIGWWF